MHIWLRCETKEMERRSPLSPRDAKALIENGCKVSVERSEMRIFDNASYVLAGCRLEEPGSWVDAPTDVLVLGLKELERDFFSLYHKHVHFAHAFKGQNGAAEFLKRFTGNSLLYDLEYLVDDDGKRIAAFGYWAGYAGAAISLMAFLDKMDGREFNIPTFKDRIALLNELKNRLKTASKFPHVLIIGANGRCGNGGVDLFSSLGLSVVKWDKEETVRGGPFVEILSFDILLNCVFVNAEISPFLTNELIHSNSRSLSLICDVSCDPYSGYNPLPIYNHCTSFSAPVTHLIEGANALDLIAIDNLPSFLPMESSLAFSANLLPYLLEMHGEHSTVWLRAEKVFQEKLKELA